MEEKYVCPQCGYEAKAPGICPKCRAHLVATCPVCGNPVVAEHVQPPED
ncbi:hypothetical protein ACFLWY_02005 [Chloroflexota bacterium]